MARDFTSDSHVLTAASNVSFASARSWSAWIYIDVQGSARIIDIQGDVAFIYTTATVIGYQQDFSGNPGQWGWSVTPSTGAWHHLLVTHAGLYTNDPILYIDGTTQGAPTENSTPASTSNNSAGAFLVGNRADTDRRFDGRIAEVALWNSVLTSGNATSLAGGLRSDFVGTPAYYWPLLGDDSPEPEHMAGTPALNVTGAGKGASHPSMNDGAAGGQSVVPVLMDSYRRWRTT